MENLSATLKNSELDHNQRTQISDELRAVYVELTKLAALWLAEGKNPPVSSLESIGEQWPVIDQRASQPANLPMTTAWISNLLHASSSGLISGGTKDLSNDKGTLGGSAAAS